MILENIDTYEGGPRARIPDKQNYTEHPRTCPNCGHSIYAWDDVIKDKYGDVIGCEFCCDTYYAWEIYDDICEVCE